MTIGSAIIPVHVVRNDQNQIGLLLKGVLSVARVLSEAQNKDSVEELFDHSFVKEVRKMAAIKDDFIFSRDSFFWPDVTVEINSRTGSVRLARSQRRLFFVS